MLVQALAAYADTYLADDLKAVAFEDKPVRYQLEIDEDGGYLGMQERVRTEQRGEGRKVKTIEVVDTMRVPRSPVNRNSGVHPLLGCDAPDYVLGPQAADKNPDKAEQNHAGFIDLIRKAAEESGDAALRACSAFYDDPDELAKALKDYLALKPKPGALISLAVRPRRADAPDPGGPVIGRRKAQEWWARHYARKYAERHAEGGQGVCLVSGAHGPLAVTHCSDIKGLGSLGGQSKGVALMSFDKDAFTSYGWDKAANSPVNPERVQAYGLALNDLLRLGSHRPGSSEGAAVPTRSDYGGMAFLYWTREPADNTYFDYVNDPNPENMRKLMDAVHRPAQTPSERLVKDFYLLAVSGNGGRLVVRDWFPESVAAVAQNVRQWFDDLAMADVFQGGERARPPSLYALLRAISPPGTEPQDKANGRTALALVRRALQDKPVGYGVLGAALNRLRREQGKSRLAADRVGLIRLCVNDIQKHQGGPIMADALDENQNDAAYLCGQLLAVYEAMQYQALGEVNVTVGDRYFAMASTRPLLAFKQLEDLSRAHLKRLRRDKRGAAVAQERRVHDLCERIGQSAHGNFPTALSLEEQGRFVIGYHHQKAKDARDAKEAKARREAQAEASATATDDSNP